MVVVDSAGAFELRRPGESGTRFSNSSVTFAAARESLTLAVSLVTATLLSDEYILWYDGPTAASPLLAVMVPESEGGGGPNVAVETLAEAFSSFLTAYVVCSASGSTGG